MPTVSFEELSSPRNNWLIIGRRDHTGPASMFDVQPPESRTGTRGVRRLFSKRRQLWDLGRPVLWDKTLDIYKDRNQTKKAWKEVCKKLKSNFEELSDTEKNSFSNEIAKKWTNVRDSFVKSNKRLKELRTCGVASFKPKKYVYTNQLQFLSKLIEERPTEERSTEDSLSESTSCTDEGEINSDICAAQLKELEKQLKSRKRRHDEFELKLIKALETSESQPNRHISFFNGIIPSLEKLDDDDIIKFQIGVLQLLETIKRNKQQQNVCSQPPTLCRCSAINTVKCSF